MNEHARLASRNPFGSCIFMFQIGIISRDRQLLNYMYIHVFQWDKTFLVLLAWRTAFGIVELGLEQAENHAPSERH